AVMAQSVGGGGGLATLHALSNPAAAAVLGGYGGAAPANGGSVTLTMDSAVTTTGARSIGVLAQSVGGGGGVALSASDPLTGMFAAGNGDGGAVVVNVNAAVMTSGDGAHGIIAQSLGGGGGIVIGSTGLALGSGDPLAANHSGGPITIDVNADVHAAGAGAIGIITHSSGPVSITVQAGATVAGGIGAPAILSFGSAGGSLALHANLLAHGPNRNGTSIENRGTISAGPDLALANGAAIAIATGDGDDIVTLAAGAVAGGIALGAGDDVLYSHGGSVSGPVHGDSGSDLLHLVGAGDLPGGTSGFENLVKQANGRFAIGLWDATGTTSIEAGSVAVAGNSLLGAGHWLTTLVRSDGSNGALSFDAVPGGSQLRGNLAVQADAGIYIDGTHWDVVDGAALGGDFASVVLPGATALRSFTSAKASSSVNAPLDRYRVTVAVLPLQAMAADALQASFAAALDRAAPAASGDLALTIARLQEMP
ncbi:MAG: hypothetical protein ACRCUI_13920, partial [Polymorphobacter sp.]